MNHDSSNERVQGRLRKREKNKQRILDEGLRFIMATANGRAFVYDLIYRRCDLEGVYLSKDAGIHTHQGRRIVGKELRDDVERLAPDLWLQMLSEQKQMNDLDRTLAREAEAEPEETYDA